MNGWNDERRATRLTIDEWIDAVEMYANTDPIRYISASMLAAYRMDQMTQKVFSQPALGLLMELVIKEEGL